MAQSLEGQLKVSFRNARGSTEGRPLAIAVRLRSAKTGCAGSWSNFPDNNHSLLFILILPMTTYATVIASARLAGKGADRLIVGLDDHHLVAASDSICICAGGRLGLTCARGSSFGA
jgi:hypothetical protein